jgi:hypothetical protein
MRRSEHVLFRLDVYINLGGVGFSDPHNILDFLVFSKRWKTQPDVLRV